MTHSASPEMEVHSIEGKQKHGGDKDWHAPVKKSEFNFDLASDFTWSEDGSEKGGFCLSDIHDSVAAIREEASHFDAILAIDQLDTLKGEIATLQRELNARTEELDEMRELVSLKDARICTLELECDLYKADCCNQKDELKECISTMTTFDSNSEQDPTTTEEEEKKSSPGEDVPDLPADQTPSTCTETSSDSSKENTTECVQFVPPQVTTRQIDPPSCGCSVLSSSSETTCATESRSPAGLYPRSLLFPVQEQPSFATPSRKLKASANPQRRSRGRSFPFCLAKQRKQHEIHIKVEEELEPNELYLQMEHMSHRMHSAIATSEELRRRLAMLNRYYESSICKLQEEVVDAKASRDQVEFDLSRQIANIDRERRQALEKVESAAKRRKERKGSKKKVDSGVL